MRVEAAERAARLLRDALEKRSPLPSLPEDCQPHTLDDAYQIQRRFVALLGTPVGYKVGYTNAAIQKRFGVEFPISGRLLAGRLLDSPGRHGVRAPFRQAAEPEFAYRLGRDLPPRAAPFERSAIEASVESLAPSLELVECRFEDWERIGPLLTVCDNVLGSHWVGGEPLREWRHADVPSQLVVASVNGEEFTRGHGSDVLGDPLESLRWLANDLARRGEGLRAGDLVTTGCCTRVIEARAGDTVEADFGPFGRVSVTFEPWSAQAGQPSRVRPQRSQ